MNTRDNDPFHAPINAKLAEVVAALPTPPAWHDAWMGLGPDIPEDERLRVYQAIRDSGVLPEDAGFYLVSWQIDSMASRDAEVSLSNLEERMEAIEESHGLEEDDPWPSGEAPDEWEELRRQYQDAWDGIFAEALEEHGEQAMAQQYQADREEFERRSEAGRQYFHGAEEADDWVQELAEAVGENMTDEGGPGKVGFRYLEEDGLWTVYVYLTPVELVGGLEDGEIVVPGFSLDLEGLRSLFDRVDGFSWQALGLTYPEGPHVSIEGLYQGHEVYLQVLAYAPEDEEPGLRIDTSPRKP